MTVILSLNSGSSSVKASVYTIVDASPHRIAHCEISGLTAPPTRLSYTSKTGEARRLTLEIRSNEEACDQIVQRLVSDPNLEEINDRNAITHICHRVVHGGDYPTPQVIDANTFHYLEKLTDLAPLHNASALAIIRKCVERYPKAINIAYFDSSFHASIPPYVYTYAIDPKTAESNHLRKYGFHGLSYSFITKAVAFFLDQQVNQTNLIVLHLGSGASACAIRDGKSFDTTMGLTPLAGLPGATRSGDVDPSLIFHFTHNAGQLSQKSTQNLHISTAEEILNQQSGWKALTGTTDFEEIQTKATDGDPTCTLALDMFVDRIVGFIGNYYVRLGGRVDAIVFAGGIGEKSASLRQLIIRECQCLGFGIDSSRNRDLEGVQVVDIGRPGSSHRALVCRTDEQFEMAEQCASSL